MKKMRLAFVMLMICLMIGFGVVIGTGCTAQQRAFTFGGSATVDLPKGQKLVNITWKDDNLWFLTRTMTPTDIVEQYSFQESSSFGLLEGAVTIKENR